jgi:hypothetical protein
MKTKTATLIKFSKTNTFYWGEAKIMFSDLSSFNNALARAASKLDVSWNVYRLVDHGDSTSVYDSVKSSKFYDSVKNLFYGEMK